MSATPSVAVTGPGTLPDPEQTYRLMVRLRRFEERAYALYLQNYIHGTMHLGLGQEAVAAGVAAALRPDDYSLTTYRGHNHVIARGAPAGCRHGRAVWQGYWPL